MKLTSLSKYLSCIMSPPARGRGLKQGDGGKRFSPRHGRPPHGGVD